MSSIDPHNPRDEFLIDLLVKQLTEHLTPAEQAMLDQADGAAVEALRRELEQTAAAIAIAATPTTERMPPALADRLELQAEAFVATTAARLEPRRDAASPSRRGAAGWWAAAACLLLAMTAWFRAPPPAVMTTEPAHPVVAPAQRTPVEQRALLLSDPATVKIALAATKDPSSAGVSGDVVWNPVSQQGYIRLAGVSVNDPKIHQYQIWIFDAERDQRYPVDGGVFDVPTNGEAIIPVHAAVSVRAAKMFAITIEKPGGVVVSAREHIVALAQAT